MFELSIFLYGYLNDKMFVNFYFFSNWNLKIYILWI